MESPQAITKILLPSKRGNLLHRPRLVDFLHEHIERKLLLVSAPAGYGKTSLLVDFAHDTTLPVCWYSLDPTDADPKVFLEYIIASLRRQFPNFGSRTLQVLADPSSTRDVAVVVGALVTEIHEDIPGYFVLILDDYHTIEESEKINQILDSFLRLLPENAHLLLASRTLPSQLTLTRLTARQEIAGLGQNDLRFSADEIRAFVKQNYDVELAEKDALELAANSEGWITGILLTTHTLWQGLFQNLVRTQGPYGNVFTYLANEVFEQQPPELQRFLLDSSILDQLNPNLCDKLFSTPNSAEMLRWVEQKNLFVTRLESEELWYRFHHLFHEFLESRLIDSNRARWQNLHQRAAELFESQGVWDQVIHHHLAIGAFEDAACAIEKIAKETFDAGHWTTLAKWVDGLPVKALDMHPSLVVWRGHLHAETGNLDKATELYSQALKIFERQNDAVGIGKTLIKQAVSYRFQGLYSAAVENCQRALSLLSQDAKNDIAEAHRTIGIALARLGDWERCIQELETALTFRDPAKDFADIALLYQDLGVAYRTAGRSEAQGYFQNALDYWRRANNTSGLANTLNSIGVGHHRKGEYEEAIRTLERARSEAQRSGQLRIETAILASLGDVYRDQGKYLRAQETYKEAFDIAGRINEGFFVTYTLSALGETFRLVGDLETAKQLLSQALQQAQNHHSNYEVGLVKTALGILDCERGNPRAGADQLKAAVELFEQGGAKRDSARAHLQLAFIHYAMRKYQQADAHLKVTANLARRLNEDQFIVADGKQLRPLLKYAALKKIGNGYFNDVLAKIKSLPLSSADDNSIVTEIPIPRIQARAFGAMQVMLNEKLVTRTAWDSVTSRELYFLLLEHPEGLRREEILDLLCPNIPPAKAKAILHSTAYRIRRALFADCLIFKDGVYRIGTNMDLSYDVRDFVELIQKAKTAEAEADRATAYRQAIALYQGDYLEECYSDWCIPIRANLLVKYLDAVNTLAAIHTQRNEFEKAVALYRKILEKDNYREDIYRAIMRVQTQAGDRIGAIKTYHLCLQVLKDDMGIIPSQETQTLYEDILRESSANH